MRRFIKDINGHRMKNHGKHPARTESLAIKYRSINFALHACKSTACKSDRLQVGKPLYQNTYVLSRSDDTVEVKETGGLQSRFFPGNAGFQPASEFVGILPVQGGDLIP
ncbi:MAG: hypothetical protein FWC43_13800, partial [Planctomycetaceae bacterium]|nr:hypothetical protein [Planctomycetaceae bacterium]